jgi:hypothetical protein
VVNASAVRPLLSLACVAISGCSSKAPSGQLKIVTGEETDTFTRAPAPVTLQVDSIDTSGHSQTLATKSLPTASIDLGSLDESAVATLEVLGLDANGNRLVFGRSIPIQFGALDGLTIPLFVQRTGELARLPSPLPDARTEPTLAVIGGRFLFVGGGADSALASTIQLYDFAGYSALGSPPTMPRIPESVAMVRTVGWLIDGAGATQFDFSNSSSAVVIPPTGGSFGEVAGGATVSARDGSQFVVGATRTTGAATARVLALDPSGKPSWLTLSAPRLGAAATWVEGQGLVVAGGSATASGVEMVSVGSTTGAPLAYPPDASTGAGATALDRQHVLLAGGVAPPASSDAGARTIDLACLSQCAPAPWSPLPAAVVPAQAFAIDPANALVVGSEPVTGTTHVYRLTSATATELMPKVAHARARAVASPVGPPGSVIVFGGANEIESFTP